MTVGVKQQCMALTRKRVQCKNRTVKGSRYCLAHSIMPCGWLGVTVGLIVSLVLFGLGVWLSPSKEDVAAVPEMTVIAIMDSLHSRGLFDLTKSEDIVKRINLAYGGIDEATQDEMDEALSALRGGEFAAAEETYRALIQKYPGEPSFYMNLSFALRMQQRYTDAVDPAKRAAELAGSSPFAWMVLGTAYSDAGFAEDGKRAYRNAINLLKILPDVYMSMGATYSEQDSLGAARLFYDSALIYDQQNPYVFYNLANVYRRLGHDDSTAIALGRAVRLNPDNGKWRYSYAQALARIDRSDEAMFQFRIAIQQDSSIIGEFIGDSALDLE
jgi:tetratricopeptide (TPR) repeat protein